MKETIKETIKKIYIDKNYNFFLEKCQVQLMLLLYIQRDAQKHIVFEVRFRYLRASKSSGNLLKP